MTSFEKTLGQIGPVWAELYDGLWHTTLPDRYRGILETGFIEPEPNIPNRDRWASNAKPSHYPISRHLGGVSLFDFKDFDPDSYEEKHPNSMWRTFAPYYKKQRGGVWIEIDRTLAGEKVIPPDDLVARWDTDGNRGRNILPRLEAAHIGPIPIASFSRVLFIQEGGRFYSIKDMTLEEYDEVLREWRKDFPPIPEEERMTNFLSRRSTNFQTREG